MSSFTGVSVITDGKNCTTTAVDTGTDSVYHLLVVKGYSSTVNEIPNGENISSGPFMAGGHQWYIQYYPNGEEERFADLISLNVIHCCDSGDVCTEEAVKVHCVFSFVDQVEYQKTMHIRAAPLCSLSAQADNCICANFIKRDTLELLNRLKDDCLTIRIDIMVCKDSNTHDVGATMSDIGQHFDNLLQNKVGADVVFKVSGETFPAHRCVLAARSTVFMAQLFGPMKEGTESSVIQIKDMAPKVFRALLIFIYTGSFPEMEKENKMEESKAENVEEEEEEEAENVEEEEEEVEKVMWLHDLFVAADMYDLQRLKHLCEEELFELIGVRSVASTLALAEQHHCHGLKEACLKFIQAQSIPCLEKVMATDGWKHITMTYPSVVTELITKLASNQKDKKRKR